MSQPDVIGARAITLHNPWAHAIAHYGKDVENRGWAPPEHITRLLIHAGKQWDPSGMASLRARGMEPLRDTVPSAIVAVADLAHVCDAAMRGARCECGHWSMPGQYHWKLGKVWTLPEPVPCPGRQGLWLPNPDLLVAVRKSLANRATERTPQ